MGAEGDIIKEVQQRLSVEIYKCALSLLLMREVEAKSAIESRCFVRY